MYNAGFTHEDYTLTTFDYNKTARNVGNASTVVVRRGMGPLSVLGIIFVLLKLFELTAVATWSWWLVLLPFYVGFAIVLGICGIILGVFALVALGFGLVLLGAYVCDAWKYRYRVKPARR